MMIMMMMMMLMMTMMIMKMMTTHRLEEAKLHLDNEISNIREQWTLMVRDDKNQTLIIYLHLLVLRVIISFLSQPSSLRLDPIYIKLYLLCTNLAINGIIPATLLITLNLLTFLQVLDFKKVTSSSSSTSSS